MQTIGSSDQIIDAKDIKAIHIHCYCKSGFVRKISTDNKIAVRVVGTQSSVGYHGSQDIPKDIPEKLLSFKESRNGSFLKLESREYTFIHHAYLIDFLEVSAPEKVKIIKLPLRWNELQGRKINERLNLISWPYRCLLCKP